MQSLFSAGLIAGESKTESGSGSQVLLPFIQRMLQHVENTLLTNERPKELPEVLAGSKAIDELSCYCEDDVVGLIPHFPLVTIAPGEYFGFRIEKSKQPVALVYDLRKSKSKGRALQGSVDGKVWFNLLKTGADRMDTIPIHEPRVRLYPLYQSITVGHVDRDWQICCINKNRNIQLHTGIKYY